MECPPNKRLKGDNYRAPQNGDSFGDEEDFTQDDLDEIDIIASQALTSDGGCPSVKESDGLPRKTVSESRRTFDLGDGSTSSNKAQRGKSVAFQQHETKEAFRFCAGKEDQSKTDRDDFLCDRLQAQQADLRKKLKEMEEELLMRNGEIRVLRDSLRQAKLDKEQQRQEQLLQEQERVQIQSEKEKTLTRKVQSLQSELHFKEAEINEMKSRLQNSDRSVKQCVSPAARNSPMRSTLTSQQQEAGGAQGRSPGLTPFLTKEVFGAQLPKQRLQQVSHVKEDGKHVSEIICSVSNDAEKGTLSSKDRPHSQESSLLNLLLQQPSDPSRLSLCHLLCVPPDALPSLLPQHSSLSSGSSLASSGSSTERKTVHRPCAGFSQVQNLAVTGLNMLALRRHQQDHGVRSGRSCPEAVHLLPLLEHHVDLFCQVLETAEGPARSPLRDGSLSGSSGGSSLSSGTEETLSCLEEFALTALGTLCHLVSHSKEVVRVLMCCQTREHAEEGVGTSHRGTSGAGLHPLLRRALQLASPAAVNAAHCSDVVLRSSLQALNRLAENSAGELLSRLKCVLSTQCVVRCLGVDSSSQTVHLCLSLLGLIASNDEIAMLLCSHLDACPLLKMFEYITSRPNISITENQWCQFELEVVRLLTKLLTQKMTRWAAFVRSSCQCISEVVRTLVVILHRQWLGLRGQEQREGQSPTWKGPEAHLLKETLMLLHWFSLNDAAFTERCLDVLHLYDLVIPAIRDSFRKIPNLTEIEELALEEMCRPESEDCEDMDIVAGS